MRSLSCFIVFTCCVLSAVFLSAQNLIPNPGFEEHHGDTVLYWKQPSGEYYHYEYYSSYLSFPHSGMCDDGICMHYRDNLPNEYLKIKLKESLQNGKKYHLEMFVRLAQEKTWNALLLDSIGWYFSNDSSPTVHGFNNVIPQVSFFITQKNISERFRWMRLEEYYIASGTEQYLTIGNFPKEETFTSTPINSPQFVVDTVKTQTEEEDEEEEEMLESAAIVKKEKKHKGNSKKENEMFRQEVQKKRIEAKQKYVLREIIRVDSSYNIRYYFDDLYLGLDTLNQDTAKQEHITLKIFFETGKAILLPKSYAELDKTLLYLKKDSTIKAIFHGHTDNHGDSTSNKLLSQDRAKAVVEYLMSKGISSSRLSYKGWGSTKPIDDNKTAIGREKNRRVELEVTTNQEQH